MTYYPEDIEVLLSTINQNNTLFLHDQNITGFCTVINQNMCEKESIVKNDKFNIYTYNEKGVGLSRNLAFLHSSKKILLFADDDEVLFDEYEQIVSKAYNELPDADMIIFDINLTNSSKNGNFRHINKIKKLNKFNSMRYGACRFSVKRESLIRNRITFSTLFGGGSRYSSGEDSLFILDCLKANMKIYQYPAIIADVDDSSSTWYFGENDKFYKDKGIFYYVAFPKLYLVLYPYYAFKLFRKSKEYSFMNILKLFFSGKKEYRHDVEV